MGHWDSIHNSCNVLVWKELKMCNFDAHSATANRCEVASDLLPAEATWSPTMPVSKCPGLGFNSEQHCPSLYPLNWIQSSPNGWKLNSFTFVLVIQSHGRRMQLLQRCEIEMACHVPGYWARTETWISLWFQLKLRGASMEAGQVCWVFIFYLLVIPSKWPSQPASQEAQGVLKRVEGSRDTLAVDWEASKLPHHYYQNSAQQRQNTCCTQGHKCFHKWYSF